MGERESDVHVAPCGSYGLVEVRAALREALSHVGGPGVARGDTVLVKPNLLVGRPPRTCVNTHPHVVRAVVEELEALGVEVLVGDSPAVGGARFAARGCGLARALEGTHARVVDLRESAPAGSELFPALEMATLAREVSAIINVAKAKTHAQMGLTLATKNLFGLVVGQRKMQWHLRAGSDRLAFARLMVEVARQARPVVSILDAIEGMEGNGPGAGRPRAIGALIAGREPLAVDEVARRILGFRRDESPIFVAAEALGVDPGAPRITGTEPGRLTLHDFARAAPQEVGLPAIVPRFLRRLLRDLGSVRVHIAAGRCKHCGHCATRCPAQALAWEREGVPRIDHDRCIRCACCQETCPVGAISLRPGALARAMDVWRRRREAATRARERPGSKKSAYE